MCRIYISAACVRMCRSVCLVGQIPAGASKVPWDLTGQPGVQKICDNLHRLGKTAAVLPIGTFFFTCFLSPRRSTIAPFTFQRELVISPTPHPLSQFFFSFNFKADEKNNDGEEQEVRDDNRPKGREEHYEEEEEEEEDGAAVAEKSRRRAEM